MHDDAETPERSRMERLLHRWLVEYNPLYLASAAFVCGGSTLLSQEMTRGDSVPAIMGVAAIAEVYAFALIGGAALLFRLGRRRPAAMLGLLAALFQCDPMLHVETCSYLGVAGRLATAVWLVLFFGKLLLLCRALQLRVSPSALGVAAIGALGLALLPHFFRVASPEARSLLSALWVFALGTAGLWTTRNVESAIGWDVRGRRSIYGVWLLWSAMAVARVTFWGSDYFFDVGFLVPIVPLLAIRFARRESEVWIGVALALLSATWFAPSNLWLIALMAATTLGLVAWRARLARMAVRTTTAPAPPYRSYEPLHQHAVVVAIDVSDEARPRLLMGMLFASHLAAWSSGWLGGHWPPHHLWLDATLVVAGVALCMHFQRPALATSLSPLLLHLAVVRGWVEAPDTPLEWGAASVGVGFSMLFGSLFASWLLISRERRVKGMTATASDGPWVTPPPPPPA